MSRGGKVLIDIKNLTVDYPTYGGLFGRNKQFVRVLSGLDLQILQGETLGIVGESGCGKSTLGNAIMRLLTPSGGNVIYRDTDILKLNKKERRRIRRYIQLVFQNPHASLNPRMSIYSLVAEPLHTHTKLSQPETVQRVEELLINVGLSGEHMTRYPHQISGGQAQRVVLARALALNPAMLILDEPTSALDVSVQAQIINLMVRLQKEHNLTYLFISHDLGVVQHISDRIAVMYLGEIVELAASESLFNAPQHPYSQALLSVTPIPDPNLERKHIFLQGNVPSPANPPSGCRFHTRCPVAIEKCKVESPPPVSTGQNQWAKCHLVEPVL